MSLVYATYICNQKLFSKCWCLCLTESEDALKRLIEIVWWPSQSYSVEESCKDIDKQREVLKDG